MNRTHESETLGLILFFILTVAFLVGVAALPTPAHGRVHNVSVHPASVLRYGPILDAQAARLGVRLTPAVRATFLRCVHRESHGGVAGNGPWQFIGGWHRSASMLNARVPAHKAIVGHKWWRCMDCSTAAILRVYAKNGARGVRRHWSTFR